VSREALGVAMFHAGLSAFTFFKVAQIWLDWAILDVACYAAGGFAVLSAVLGLFFMCTSYRIKARPFWNHWQVSTTFYGTLFSLGGVLIAAVALPVLLFTGGDWAALLPVVALMTTVGLVVEGVGLVAHAKHLNVEAGEGAASHYMQQTIFGKTYIARNLSIAIAAIAAVSAAIIGGVVGLALMSLSALLSVVALLAGRALYYVLVVPTTMPGAFFWKNKGFEEHARDIGLADMPQVGVVPDLH
jgi:DMSO reductase anchor subunit